jgi:DNA-directed RNA polymerase specialized sigma24 family protein
MPLDHEDQDMPELVRQLFGERRLNALGEIFARHYPRLRSLACSRLKQKKVPAAVYDADDALGSSLENMMRLVLTGRVESIKDFDGFWRLFRQILAWKISAASNRQSALKRGGTSRRKRKPDGALREDPGDAAAPIPAAVIPPDDFDLFKSNLPAAEVEAISKETTDRLIGLLDTDQQSIVRMRIDGHGIADIAATFRVSPRTINRVLERIRRIWESSGLVDGMKPKERRRDQNG